MSVSADLQGVEAMRRRLRDLARSIPNEVARALYQEAQIELGEIKRRTPVDTNALRASEMVERPVVEGRDISVRLVAGGPSAPYALFVHEDLEAFHPVGQAKYMESVLMESAPHIARRIASRIDLGRV
jgi:hypothetical protein